jgi:predicted nicotinamide N-methyase
MYSPESADRAWDRCENSGGQPYWAEIWPASIYCARWLARQASLQTQIQRTSALPSLSRLLDFGCGLGLTGVTALAIGLQVDFADISPDALLFAKINCLQNGFDAANSAYRQFDWERDSWETRYDWIVASDVFYDADAWTPVEQFWSKHLSMTGVVIVAEPGRRVCQPLTTWLEQRGWQVNVLGAQSTRLLILRKKP